jgi:Holliday junction resolvase-like predicted endonuclease
MITNGEAGHGARAEGQRAAAAADALERKAANARQIASNFEKGAEGELEAARALAELTVTGWRLLHDRCLPHGGNIDHIAVGPAGVVVVDAKAWSGPVTVDAAGRLRTGRYDRTRQVEQLMATTSAVQAVLRAAGHSAPVRAVLALSTGTPAGGQATATSQGALVLSVANLAETISRCPATVPQRDVDALTACVADAFPPASDDAEATTGQPHAATQPAGELFLKANVFLYAEPWARAGRRRIYLNDTQGTTLGYKDLNANQVSVTGDADPEIVRAVLRHAHPGGLGLVRSELPRIPIQLPGGRLIGALGRLWTSFLIGQHWRRAGKDRLYVTHALPGQGIFDVGYADLTTGTLYPTSTEPLGKELRPPRRYLELTLERYPRR